MGRIQYNVCDTCGAKDGRAGNLIGWKGQMECECCRDTRRTGDLCLHNNLPRTSKEVDKIATILDDWTEETPMKYATIDDVMNYWTELWGNVDPEDEGFGKEWLQDRIQAAGLRYEDVDEDWLDDAWIDAMDDPAFK